MAELRVNTRHLRDVAAQLRAQSNQMKQQVESLKASQRTLTSQWDGPANEAFDRSFNRNVNEFDAFAALITDYGNALVAYAEQYEAAEAKNAQMAGTR